MWLSNLPSLVFALAGAYLTASGCSFVLDSSGNQCSLDADCDRFGASCQAGVCVGQAFQFDNCKQLQLCDTSALDAAYMKTVPPMSLGSVPGPIVKQQKPTINCADVSPNIIYITGSTNLPPLLQAVQPLLDQGTPPYTAVFAPQTSCKGAAAIYDPSPAKHMIQNTDNNYAFYYNKEHVQTLCLLDETSGNVVDVGESDVYPSSCGYMPTQGIADYSGPIQAITFVVPSSSRQTAISAEAAHLLFAAGGDNGRTAPWVDPHLYFVRSSGTGTVQLPSRAMSVDPTMWWGIDRLSAGNLVDSMKEVDPTLTEQAIGVLSSDFADKNRANLRQLAFQAHGQRFAYLADSTAESFDKLNVRNGHYPIWGAIHFVAVTSNGVPSPAAGALIKEFTVSGLDENLVSAIIEAGFVPPCAMKVTHATEVGTLMPFQPAYGCSCFYEQKVGTPNACQACSIPADCPSSAPACNYGFCEKQ